MGEARPASEHPPHRLYPLEGGRTYARLRLLAHLVHYAMSRTLIVPSFSRRTLNRSPVVLSCVYLGTMRAEQRPHRRLPLHHESPVALRVSLVHPTVEETVALPNMLVFAVIDLYLTSEMS